MPGSPRPVSGCWPPERAGWAGPSTASCPTSGTGAGRSGEARDEILRLTAEAGALLVRSVREARRALAAVPAQTSTAARRTIERLEILIGQATTVIDQIGKRVRDERITDRLVSFADPDARPVRKGKIATPWGSETPNRSCGEAVVLVDEPIEQVAPPDIARVGRDRLPGRCER